MRCLLTTKRIHVIQHSKKRNPVRTPGSMDAGFGESVFWCDALDITVKAATLP